MPVFHVSKIVIIDSLDEEEFQTGVEIEKFIRYEFAEYRVPIDVERYSVSWAGEFIAIIERLAQNTDYNFPLLHIEMHGDENDGLIFANNSHLSWEEVGQALAPLNCATRFNLVCVFSACYGAYFTKSLLVNYAAPCFALIAPEKEVDPGEVHRAFRILYHNLAKFQDLGLAADILAKEVPIDGGWFDITMSEWFYQVLYAFALKNCSATAIKQRAASLTKRLNSLPVFGLTSADIEVRAHLKNPNTFTWTASDMEILILVKTYQYLSNLTFERFFMIDALPENEYRFAETKQSVLRDIVPLIGK